jgi:hypothetical protein
MIGALSGDGALFKGGTLLPFSGRYFVTARSRWHARALSRVALIKHGALYLARHAITSPGHSSMTARSKASVHSLNSAQLGTLGSFGSRRVSGLHTTARFNVPDHFERDGTLAIPRID